MNKILMLGMVFFAFFQLTAMERLTDPRTTLLCVNNTTDNEYQLKFVHPHNSWVKKTVDLEPHGVFQDSIFIPYSSNKEACTHTLHAAIVKSCPWLCYSHNKTVGALNFSLNENPKKENHNQNESELTHSMRASIMSKTDRSKSVSGSQEPIHSFLVTLATDPKTKQLIVSSKLVLATKAES